MKNKAGSTKDAAAHSSTSRVRAAILTSTALSVVRGGGSPESPDLYPATDPERLGFGERRLAAQVTLSHETLVRDAVPLLVLWSKRADRAGGVASRCCHFE
jgi:hypothetical protein